MCLCVQLLHTFPRFSMLDSNLCKRPWFPREEIEFSFALSLACPCRLPRYSPEWPVGRPQPPPACGPRRRGPAFWDAGFRQDAIGPRHDGRMVPLIAAVLADFGLAEHLPLTEQEELMTRQCRFGSLRVSRIFYGKVGIQSSTMWPRRGTLSFLLT